jgi:hypothetical protein
MSGNLDEQSEEDVSYNEEDDKASTSTEECDPDDCFNALPKVNRSL